MLKRTRRLKAFIAGLLIGLLPLAQGTTFAQSIDISPPSSWQIGEEPDPDPPPPPPPPPPPDPDPDPDPELQVIQEFQSAAIEFDANDDFTPTLEYRLNGSSTWLPAHQLDYDPHDTQWRGALVWLSEGTAYEVQVTYNGVTFFRQFSTWPPVSTWTVGSTTNFSTSQVITTGGSATGANADDMPNHTWKVYDGQGSTISGGSECIHIDANYVIVRNFTCTGQSTSGNVGGAVNVAFDRHHVVIENCEITAWGNAGHPNNDLEGNGLFLRVENDQHSNPAGSSKQHNVVIQRCNIHSPAWGKTQSNYNSSQGPRAISWRESDSRGNFVVRYNTMLASSTAAFSDAIGGGRNNSYMGFPGNNFAFYRNYMRWCVDDCAEFEGGNKNMRVWQNYSSDHGVGIATAAIWRGPAYLFNNVFGATWGVGGGNGAPTKVPGRTMTCDNCGYSATGSGNRWNGRTYFYNNSFRYISGISGATPRSCNHWGGDPRAQTGVNNICETSTQGAIEDLNNYDGAGGQCYGVLSADQFNYWHHNYARKNVTYQCSIGGTDGVGSIISSDFASWEAYTHPLSPGQAGTFQLTNGAPGHDDGIVIPNFNSGRYLGAAPDMGAQERGESAMCFGHSC